MELTSERVLAGMDKLAAAVREIDPVVYEYSWGRAHLKDLKP